MGTDDVGTDSFPGEEVVNLARGAVVDGDNDTMIIHIEDEIPAHYRQADDSNVRFRPVELWVGNHGRIISHRPRLRGAQLGLVTCLDNGVARAKTTLFGVVLLIGLGACSGSTQGTTTVGGGGLAEVAGEVDWSMADRFGLDANGDGLPDVPNTLDYVLNQPAGTCADGCSDIVARFDVELDATDVDLVSPGSAAVPISSYTWTLTTSGGDPLVIESDEPRTIVQLPEGEFDLTLDVAGDGSSATVATAISVDDILLVALGDSFAGGEGNPERPGDPPVWADDGSRIRTQQAVDHELAHRSTRAAAAQAALELEESDPRTSVTFVFLAASGASITEGVLGTSEDTAAADTDGFRAELRPQVEEMKQLLGCNESSCRRGVDALTMSLGGNDIRFSFALGSLIALEPQLLLGTYDNLLDRLLSDVATRIDQLPQSFAILAQEIRLLDIDAVYLTAYPSGGSQRLDDEVVLCEEAGGDLVPGLEVDRAELEVLDNEIVGPLNDALRAAANTHDWIFVDGHLPLFAAHGYCGSDPYARTAYTGNPFPAAMQHSADPDIRWFRQAAESVEIQGGGGFFEPDLLATSGTFHPNEFGHQAYSSALLEAMRSG